MNVRNPRRNFITRAECDGSGAPISPPELRTLSACAEARQGRLRLRSDRKALSRFPLRHRRERAGTRASAHREGDPRAGGAAHPLVESVLSRVPGAAGEKTL